MSKFVHTLPLSIFKRFFIYFTYVIIASYMVYRGYFYRQYQLPHTLEMYPEDTMNWIIFDLVDIFFPVVTGILIALPQFVLKFKTKGSWNFDWIKFLAVGLPIIYIALTRFIVQTPLFPEPMMYLCSRDSILFIIIGIVFGYLLMASFYKQQKE